MTKIKMNFKYIYSTIINSLVTVTAIPFPLRSTFTTDIHLKYMQKTGKRVVEMIVISMKDATLCNNQRQRNSCRNFIFSLVNCPGMSLKYVYIYPSSTVGRRAEQRATMPSFNLLLFINVGINQNLRILVTIQHFEFLLRTFPFRSR